MTACLTAIVEVKQFLNIVRLSRKKKQVNYICKWHAGEVDKSKFGVPYQYLRIDKYRSKIGFKSDEIQL